MSAQNLKMATRNGSGDGICSGLYTVRDKVVASPVERINALYENSMSAYPFDVRSHRSKTVCQIANLGIARSI